MYIITLRVHIVFCRTTVEAVFSNKQVATKYINLKDNKNEYHIETFPIRKKVE